MGTVHVRGQNPRRRRVAAALLGIAVFAGLTFVAPVTSDAASGPFSVVDYSQCANGTENSVTCEESWINGILQASNSSYKEGQVTPQRAVIKLDDASPGSCQAPSTPDADDGVITGCHSITLSYQARKADTHAYDSLATWNTTVTGADRCLKLTNPVKTALGCSGSPTPSTLAIKADNTAVRPADVNETTSAHDLNGQYLQMYGGGILVKMTEPTHDNAQGNGDDYATTTIYYKTTVANQTVQLLFGGHLAVGPVNRGGWGEGLGSSNINGGPYHIKWTAADGTSAGSRDNQIMGSAIAPLPPATVSTTHAVAISDTATVGDLSGAQTPGTFTFTLFKAPLGTTTDLCNAAYAVALDASFANVAPNSTTWVASSPSYPVPAPQDGIYNWVVAYSGDDTQLPSSSSCGAEQTTIDM